MRQWIDAVRRNHGIEHATVTVLFERHGPRRLAGRAARDGFFILGGRVDEQTLRACADEALRRMQQGESELAVSPLCGTNIAVTGALTAAGAMFASERGRHLGLRDRFGNAMTAAILGVVAAQPLGRLVQRHLTTRADVRELAIVGVRTYAPGVRKVLVAARP